MPSLITALLSVLGALDVIRLPTGGAPVRLTIVAMALAAGLAVSMALDRSQNRAYWQMGLASVMVLLPLLALQASASRAPFVAWSKGSAGPLIWLTLATSIALVAFWLFAAIQASRSPEDGALLFLPAAVLVPAVIGAPGAIEESSALAALAVASCVAAPAIFVGLLAPQNWRPLVAGAALVALFFLLWTLGRGPAIGHDAGTIVPFSAVMLLAQTALLTVLAPLAALFGGRFSDTVHEEAGERRLPTIPAKGARRPDR